MGITNYELTIIHQASQNQENHINLINQSSDKINILEKKRIFFSQKFEEYKKPYNFALPYSTGVLKSTYL